jgi:hypothetical protein
LCVNRLKRPVTSCFTQREKVKGQETTCPFEIFPSISFLGRLWDKRK